MRFFKRKEVWVLTWLGWAFALAVLFGMAVCFFTFAHVFLSVNAPVEANVIVVEGWLPDYAMKEAVQEFNEKGYEYIVAAGGPMPLGQLVSGYTTFASIAGATLQKLHIPKDRLIEAPGAMTYRNRTFESAKAVKTRLRELGISVRGLNVVSEGPHARRTRLVYRKVFGKGTSVGILSVISRDYDAQRWWGSSEGAKTTLSEGLGWFFENLISVRR
ncbi:MAG TPA: ElyC/SanA/YdcF family protein [Spirochaetia bacterium]|nr:ElyC/SanA/YdcF family protein [Spirochaetia bacterium]